MFRGTEPAVTSLETTRKGSQGHEASAPRGRPTLFRFHLGIRAQLSDPPLRRCQRQAKRIGNLLFVHACGRHFLNGAKILGGT